MLRSAKPKEATKTPKTSRTHYAHVSQRYDNFTDTNSRVRPKARPTKKNPYRDKRLKAPLKVPA